jgi:hypothetical protein
MHWYRGASDLFNIRVRITKQPLASASGAAMTVNDSMDVLEPIFADWETGA